VSTAPPLISLISRRHFRCTAFGRFVVALPFSPLHSLVILVARAVSSFPPVVFWISRRRFREQACALALGAEGHGSKGAVSTVM
jgi:hypothetical protein